MAHSAAGTTIGVVIGKARRQRGWTQEELAARLEEYGVQLHANTLGRIERGVTERPQKATLDALIAVFALGRDEARHWRQLATRPDGRSLRRGPALLPPQPLRQPGNAFIGREGLVEQVASLVCDPETRAVTLLGTGGVGKTRLATVVAERVRSAFPDGVYALSLVELPTPTVLLTALLQLFIPERQATNAPVQVLGALLQERHLLLLLDNYETVHGAEPTLTELLTHCPKLTLLMTSQRRVLLQPHKTASLEVRPLNVAAAAILLLERISETFPALTPSIQERRAARRLVRRLEGLPLAIEIVAARAGAVPIAALADALDKHIPLDWLAEDQRERHQRTLRAAISHSFDLLSPHDPARPIYLCCATFQGGGTLEALQALVSPIVDNTTATPNAIAATDVVEGIHSLVTAQLLRRERAEDGNNRYRLLEPLRTDAAERLVASGLANQVLGQHARYYLSYAQLNHEDRTNTNHRWLRRIDLEYGNLCAALRWARENTDARLLCDLASELWPYWLNRGLGGEGKEWLQAALANDGQLTRQQRAELLTASFLIAYVLGDFERGVPIAQAALALTTATNNHAYRAMILRNLGWIKQAQGDTPATIDYLQLALAAWRLTNNVSSIAKGLGDLATCLAIAGQFAVGKAMNLEALQLLEEVADDVTCARIWADLGLIALMQRAFLEARQALETALGLLSGIQLNVLRGYILESLGIAELFTDAVALGEVHLAQALAIRYESLDRYNIGFCFLGLAVAANMQKQTHRAATLLGATNTILQTMKVHLFPAVQELYRQQDHELRSKLGLEEFYRALHDGEQAALGEMVAYALEPFGLDEV